MRWFKFGVIIILAIGGIYAFAMSFVSENKDFIIEKEISFPVDKVFPQFNNLQNFISWSAFLENKKEMSFQFYSPYKGQGSSMSYQNKKEKDLKGDLFIRYENSLKTLKFQLFEGKQHTPYLIDLKFIPINGKTKIIWYIHTPRQPFLKRSLNLISEDFWTENVNKSMVSLEKVLSNKIDKEFQRENIKYDSVFVQKQDSQLLLGINVSTKNSKDALFNNIVINHNKVINYVEIDMGKKEDEYGEPILITEADNFKDKEVSYFYGIPVSKKSGVSDNNFSFRMLNSSTNYVIFYKGSYTNRINSIQQLLTKAKRDTMRIGDLQQTFIEEPTKDDDVILKLSLPVFK
ncbi:polyketide cyclase [Chryseobacterium sp. SNU WT5]|uniref:polyketide cyclase n=1 Tax=Chryseobacterium sp. SNU WT5 TaxID=2594269 RepID=UPI0011801565|nr:polyketide cyclase [Chryseobacterium sp. SNU WT5]QDP86344.1 polyketide cyclase [Chryseobacterium sp. SNU WT5]